MRAAREGQASVVQLLITAGADVRLQNKVTLGSARNFSYVR
jgi:hypothetical protein